MRRPASVVLCRAQRIIILPTPVIVMDSLDIRPSIHFCDPGRLQTPSYASLATWLEVARKVSWVGRLLVVDGLATNSTHIQFRSVEL